MEIDFSKLRGQWVYLEEMKEEHRETLRQLAKDERIWEFTKGILLERYNEMFDAYCDLALDKNAQLGQETFIIRQISDDAIIGMTRFYQIIPKDKKLMIGYTWYLPAVWGKPHNKECKLLLLQYVFETLKYNRVEFQVAGQNIRSQKAVEKIGGIKEGVQRKAGYRGDGSLRDTVIFGIIDDEWPQTKEKLLRMLEEKQNA